MEQNSIQNPVGRDGIITTCAIITGFVVLAALAYSLDANVARSVPSLRSVESLIRPLAKYTIYLIVLLAFVRVAMGASARKLIARTLPSFGEVYADLFPFVGATLAFTVSQLIQWFTYRPRPFVELQYQPIVAHFPNSSLPSDHSIVAYSLAFALLLSRTSKTLSYSAIILATLLSAARIASGVHWVSDAVASLIISYAIVQSMHVKVHRDLVFNWRTRYGTFWGDPDFGIYPSLLLLRLLAIVGVMFRYFLSHDDEASLRIVVATVAICYLLVTSILYKKAKHTFFRAGKSAGQGEQPRKRLVIWQIVADVVAISLFYICTLEYESDLYLFLYIPVVSGIIILRKVNWRLYLCLALLQALIMVTIAQLSQVFPREQELKKPERHKFLARYISDPAWAQFIATLTSKYFPRALGLMLGAFAASRFAKLSESARLAGKNAMICVKALMSEAPLSGEPARADLDENSILQRLATVACAYLGYDQAHVWVLNAENSQLVLQACKIRARDETISQDLQQEIISTDDIAWKTLTESRRAVLFRRQVGCYVGASSLSNDVKYLPNDVPLPKCANGASEWIAVPIYRGHTLIGKLSVDKTRTNNRIDLTELSTLDILSAVIKGLLEYIEMMNALPICIYRIDESGKITWANLHYQVTIGHKLSELRGKTVFDLLKEDAAAQCWNDDRRIMISKTPEWISESHEPKGGEASRVRVYKAPILDDNGNVHGIQGLFYPTDATPIGLKHLRRDRRLLQEVHHRLRNNMEQAIVLIGERRKDAREEKQEMSILSQCETLLKTMSALHEALYANRRSRDADADLRSDVASEIEQDQDIELASYLRNVVEALKRVYATREIDFSADVSLNIDSVRALACGLIINELVTNCIKHSPIVALPGDSSRVKVGLTVLALTEPLVRISVIDAGKDWSSMSNGAGLGLVQDMVSIDLVGEIAVKRDNQLNIVEVRFPKKGVFEYSEGQTK